MVTTISLVCPKSNSFSCCNPILDYPTMGSCRNTVAANLRTRCTSNSLSIAREDVSVRQLVVVRMLGLQLSWVRLRQFVVGIRIFVLHSRLVEGMGSPVKSGVVSINTFAVGPPIKDLLLFWPSLKVRAKVALLILSIMACRWPSSLVFWGFVCRFGVLPFGFPVRASTEKTPFLVLWAK